MRWSDPLALIHIGRITHRGPISRRASTSASPSSAWPYVRPVAWTAGDRERWQPDVQRGWELVGALVKRRRRALGWSQRDLQKESGLAQSAISRLENGKLSGLRFARFARLVAAMNGLDPGAPHPTNKGLRVIAQLLRE